MTKAADLIAALLPRKAAPMLERHTGLPYGWGLWMRALPARLGTITRDKADALVLLLAQRPIRPPDPVAPVLNRYQAWRSLFYQGWEPPLREERGLRWFAGFTSAFVHVLFFLFLLWVALVQLPPPAPDAGDSSRVRLEMVGDGTPEETGGGPPAAEPSPETAQTAPRQDAGGATPVPSAPQPAIAAPTLTAEVPELAPRDVPEPTIASQPLQVTEVLEPTRAFVLPSPTPRMPDVVAPEMREAGVPTREVPMPVQAPPVRRELPQRAVDIPQIATREAQIREREVLSPAPQVREVQVPRREIVPDTLSAPEATVRQAEVRAPAPRPAAPSPAPAPTSPGATASTPSRSPSPAAGTPAAARGTQPGATASGPAAAPGGWATPQRGDDWGASNRNVAGDSGADGGDAPGLYNADGSLRVPDGAGDSIADRGAPGGENDVWTRERLEQAGTWLQRPPYDYEPTSFDKYWVPSESLLAEWVRRNVREMEISIPGTNLKLKCRISVLQLGGGCGLGSLFADPPVARPPPEIPVKRNPIPTDS
ncbi:hypothetical protein [Pseudoxanthomonas putridarboris]|uniref:Transmembrane repetitive protein n=1 Tax=Pseudoxanthomonas putridarboris TaxID=752605 RepID=A0ABU9J1Q5_9GAMM